MTLNFLLGISAGKQREIKVGKIFLGGELGRQTPPLLALKDRLL